MPNREIVYKIVSMHDAGIRTYEIAQHLKLPIDLIGRIIFDFTVAIKYE